jgi:hypothetical protein
MKRRGHSNFIDSSLFLQKHKGDTIDVHCWYCEGFIRFKIIKLPRKMYE